MNDVNSLSHTKWNCKYHIVFAPKYTYGFQKFSFQGFGVVSHRRSLLEIVLKELPPFFLFCPVFL